MTVCQLKGTTTRIGSPRRANKAHLERLDHMVNAIRTTIAETAEGRRATGSA